MWNILVVNRRRIVQSHPKFLQLLFCLRPRHSRFNSVAEKKLSHREYMLRFFLMAGSEYYQTTNNGMHRTIIRRRHGMEKQPIIVAVPGFRGRKRLTAWRDCQSPAIATKLLRGWQTNSRVWKLVPPSPQVYVTGKEA